jgi:outer membrane protein OmpA-like peptidoglycan-associated protein
MRASRPIDLDSDDIWLGSQQRSWLFVGLLVSLLLHSALCVYFYRARFQTPEVMVDSRQTPTFKVKNVDLDPKPLDKASMDQTNPAAKPNPDNTDVQLPEEKKSFDKLLQDVQASAAMPDDTRDVLPDQPKNEQPNVNSVINEIERTTAQTLAQNPNATRQQSLLTDSSASGRPQPALTGTEFATSTAIKRPNTFTSKIQGDSAGPKRGTPGFSDLDSLLAQKGPLGSGTAIRMPDDQLFEYNSADLQRSSVEQLEKLGTLIKRNPKATFKIEGYTDSFGPFDYNLDLSQRRADSVRNYLVDVMGINPGQIQTRGYGATKFLVAPRPVLDPSFEGVEIRRQQPNRRVVIVVNTQG